MPQIDVPGVSGAPMDPVKVAVAVFLIGVVAAFFLYLYSTQIAPTLRAGLQPTRSAPNA